MIDLSLVSFHLRLNCHLRAFILTTSQSLCCGHAIEASYVTNFYGLLLWCSLFHNFVHRYTCLYFSLYSFCMTENPIRKWETREKEATENLDDTHKCERDSDKNTQWKERTLLWYEQWRTQYLICSSTGVIMERDAVA